MCKKRFWIECDMTTTTTAANADCQWNVYKILRNFHATHSTSAKEINIYPFPARQTFLFYRTFAEAKKTNVCVHLKCFLFADEICGDGYGVTLPDGCAEAMKKQRQPF